MTKHRARRADPRASWSTHARARRHHRCSDVKLGYARLVRLRLCHAALSHRLGRDRQLRVAGAHRLDRCDLRRGDTVTHRTHNFSTRLPSIHGAAIAVTNSSHIGRVNSPKNATETESFAGSKSDEANRSTRGNVPGEVMRLSTLIVALHSSVGKTVAGDRGPQ